MIKAIKIFIFFIILLVVFSKQIISHTSLYFFSKLIDREIVVDEFQINYRQNSIFINNFKIMNPKEFYYDVIKLCGFQGLHFVEILRLLSVIRVSISFVLVHHHLEDRVVVFLVFKEVNWKVVDYVVGWCSA